MHSNNETTTQSRFKIGQRVQSLGISGPMMKVVAVSGRYVTCKWETKLGWEQQGEFNKACLALV